MQSNGPTRNFNPFSRQIYAINRCMMKEQETHTRVEGAIKQQLNSCVPSL